MAAPIPGPAPARVSDEHISDATPMGATLVANGATFRVWAPRAQQVCLIGEFNQWTPSEPYLLKRGSDGRWSGFLAGLSDGAKYKFWIRGEGSEGPKRDPYARELEHTWPEPACILRAADSYPWHDEGWRAPAFNDLVIYQLHVGTYFGPDREERVAKFLDVIDRVEYLADLGVNAIEPLPIIEYSTPRSMGYNGSDLFSPEMDFEVSNDELNSYLARANRLLAQKGKAPLTREVLAIPINQLKALIDICHAYGVAVILDAVYNHSSGDVRGEKESLWFFDRAKGFDPNDSLYFTDHEHTGPVFAFWKHEVRQFLIDNAAFFTEEYHVDGFRYDQVTVIVRENDRDGWRFCQDLNGALDFIAPSHINIAEYWGPDAAVVEPVSAGGAGFHASWHDGLRESVRGVLAQAAGGRGAQVNWQPVVDQLRAPGFPDAWRAVQVLEDHDEVYAGRAQRIPRVAGGGGSRTWYATSRSRVATGILLSAPGIPMLFMGEEFYEDRQWSDSASDLLISWEGLESDRTMIDFHRFTRELIWLRRKHPALRAEGVATIAMDNFNRVLAYQRWLPGAGRDVVVVASLNESTQHGYRVPFPAGGRWLEVFNSDVYENFVNPQVAGNGGAVEANGGGLNGLAASAEITIPANALLVFARDAGDF